MGESARRGIENCCEYTYKVIYTYVICTMHIMWDKGNSAFARDIKAKKDSEEPELNYA